MVSVLREIGYVASFGRISANNLSQSHCPMIGFWEDGSAFILTEIKPDGTVKYASTENKLKIKKMSKGSIFGQVFRSPYFGSAG